MDIDNLKAAGALVEKIFVNLNVATIGKVVKIDGTFADVQPLPLKSNGTKRALLINCPIVKSAQFTDYKVVNHNLIKEKIKVGDVVIVVFCDRDISNFSGASEFKIGARLHSLNDGIVVGVL